MKQVTQKFIQLVQIDSPSCHEQEMIKHLTTWLNDQTIPFKVDTTGNIYAYKKGQGNPILLCAHMDTVEPGKGIKPTIKKGVISSSGDTILGADNKAAIACVMQAVEDYKGDNSYELLFTVKEELGGGVDEFNLNQIQSKYGYVFDSSNPLGGIVLQSPYITNFHVEILGYPAHISKLSQGTNALTATIEVLKELPIGQIDEDTTLNVGVMQVGPGINTVPDKVTLSGEIRSYSKPQFKNIKQLIVDAFEKNESISKKINVTLKFGEYCAGYIHNKHDKHIKKTSRILEEMNYPVKYFFKSGISDANFLNENGINTLNLADATIFSHTYKEQIKVDDLEGLKDIVEGLIANYSQLS